MNCLTTLSCMAWCLETHVADIPSKFSEAGVECNCQVTLCRSPFENITEASFISFKFAPPASGIAPGVFCTGRAAFPAFSNRFPSVEQLEKPLVEAHAML